MTCIFKIFRNHPIFNVEADKGFFFSNFDRAFVCQKKNHFQITTHTTLKQIPVYCKPKNESYYHKIASFQLQFYGIKEDALLQIVQIKQSDSDRKPFDYKPVECIFHPGETLKQTCMRLHFSQTTQNNNRKRSKNGEILANPDQRYFLLIAEIQAKTNEGKLFPISSAASERVIVRVSKKNKIETIKFHSLNI